MIVDKKETKVKATTSEARSRVRVWRVPCRLAHYSITREAISGAKQV